jgi:hypothetical protein
MASMNHYYWPTKYSSRVSFLNTGIKCVFISYQKEDKNAALKVASYLENAGVDVYIDINDADLKSSVQRNDPKAVTSLILKGINNSSHMLVIISPNTVKSHWVPFEIGYGYDKTDLGVLCLQGIPKGALPEYIRTAPIIRDIYDLNIYIPKILKIDKDILIKSNQLIAESSYSNPLHGVMDSLIHDQY